MPLSEPPTSSDLMIVVDFLRDVATNTGPSVPATTATSASFLRVADALELLAPFAKKMEESPGNLQPLVELLMQAQTTEGSGDAASSEAS